MPPIRPTSGQAAAGGRARVRRLLLGALLAGGFCGSARPGVASSAGGGGTLASRGRSRRGGRLDHAIGNHDKVQIDLDWLAADHSRMRRDPVGHTVALKFRADNRLFDLRLKHDDSFLTPDFHVEVHRKDGTVASVQLDRSNYLSGVVAGYGSTKSHVSAIIEDGHLTASIIVGGQLYRLEPAHKYGVASKRHNHVVYSEHDVQDPTPGSCGTVTDHGDVNIWPAPDASGMGLGYDHAHDQPHDTDAAAATAALPSDSSDGTDAAAATDAAQARKRLSRRNVDVSTRNTCVLHLMADKFFFDENGASQTTTSNTMLDHLNSVNAIYKFTSFDGVPRDTRIQLATGKISIFEANGLDARGQSSPFVETTVSDTFLKSLSSLSHDGYCLSHGFTHQDFDEGILGLAYLGVICQPSSGDCGPNNGGACSRNTGITTSLNGETSSSLRTTLVLAHEVGHNFGMSHDNQCADWCETQPAETCDESNAVTGGTTLGNFIMWPSAVDGSLPYNKRFSGCSAASAGATILAKADCFTDFENGGFCGDGVVQEGEDCDCGVSAENANTTSFIDFCATQDSCCRTNCTLQPWAKCSPKAGVCCNNTCGLIGIDPNFIEEDTLQPNASVQAADLEAMPAGMLCRAATDCTVAAYCVANPAFSGKCPPDYHPYTTSAAKLNASNAATTFTFYKPDRTICSNNRASCLSGECRGSLCSAFTSNETITDESASACPLPGAGDCVIGCQFPGVSTTATGIDDCISSYDFASSTLLRNAGFEFPDGFVGKNKVPGTACDAFSGYCNVDGACDIVSTDTPFDLLLDLDVESWIWDNWWLVLCIEAGIVAFAFLLRWTKAKKDTSRWVHSQWKGVKKGISETIARNFTKAKTGKLAATMNARKRRQQEKRRRRKELAMVLGESRQLAHVRTHALKAKSGEAFSRLKCLFPYSPDDVVRQMIRLCPNEEAAVTRMLVLGHPMWKMEDYKTLHYAVRRHKKKMINQEGGRGGAKQGGRGGNAVGFANPSHSPTGSPGNPKPTVRVQARGYGPRRPSMDRNTFSPAAYGSAPSNGF